MRLVWIRKDLYHTELYKFIERFRQESTVARNITQLKDYLGEDVDPKYLEDLEKSKVILKKLNEVLELLDEENLNNE